MKKFLILALALIVFYSCEKEYVEIHKLVGTWKNYNTEIDTFLIFNHPYSGKIIVDDTTRYITWITIDDSLYYSVRYNNMYYVNFKDKYKIENDTLKFGNKKLIKIQ